MDSLELRRSSRRRETEIYLLGLLYLGVGACALWWTVGFWIDAPGLMERSSEREVVVPISGLVMTGLTLLLLWWGTPMWQLALRPGHADDVVLTLDHAGLVVTDAGFTVAVPWTSVSMVRMERKPDGGEKLFPVVSGPIERSRGRLPALVEKGMRRGVFALRVEPVDPTPDEVRTAVVVLSQGAVEVS